MPSEPSNPSPGEHSVAPTHAAGARRRSLTFAGFALCGALAALLAWLALVWQPEADQPPPAPLAGSSERLPAGGDFTLTSPEGPLALSDYRGRVVVVYFGYTFCPDVCPTSLALLGQALAMLSADELARVASLMITLDPERDTSEVLKIYAPFFHPTIVGLTGTPQQIAAVAAQYGVRYMKQKPNADGLYAVDHSAFTYVVAPDGKLAAQLPHGSAPDEIVRVLRAQLAATR
jgi:protein SCO1/2